MLVPEHDVLSLEHGGTGRSSGCPRSRPAAARGIPAPEQLQRQVLVGLQLTPDLGAPADVPNRLCSPDRAARYAVSTPLPPPASRRTHLNTSFGTTGALGPSRANSISIFHSIDMLGPARLASWRPPASRPRCCDLRMRSSASFRTVRRPVIVPPFRYSADPEKKGEAEVGVGFQFSGKR